MKQVKIDDILWVMQPEPYIITDDTDSSQIMVNCNSYKEFCTLNPSLNLTAWNYKLIRKWNPVYYEYWDDKEHSDFYFAETTQNISSYLDEDKTVTLQQLVLPEDIDVSAIYKLGDEVISGNTFVLEDAGQYVVTGIITDSSIYEDYEGSYIINYSKIKRTATLSFTNSTVNVSTFVDVNYSGTIQTANNIPSGVEVKYYLDSSLLSSNNITISTAGSHTVTAKIENDSLYNNTECSYTIAYTKVKRSATLSFANAVVEETVEDVTEYSGNVQTVSGLPTGVTANYYLGNTLLTNGVISIDNLEEGENTFTITAKLENDPVYNNTQASYNLVVTMEISSYENKYLTFEALEDGTFRFATKAVSYSVDNGKTWTELPAGTNTGTIHQGEKILWKGTNNSYANSDGCIKSTGRFNAIGNIMSLIYGDDFIENNTLNQSCFALLFANNNKIVETNNLILPSTTLANYCYSNMFNGCTSLTTAPELPATTLANNCYQSMFQGCTSLTTAPELPATTLVSNCYQSMFQGCTSLNFIKAAFSAIDSTNNTNWVQNVAATGTYIISDPNNNLDTGCIFSVNCVPPGWTVKDENDNLMSYIYQKYEVFNFNGQYTIAIGGWENQFKDTFKNIYYLKETPYNINNKRNHKNVSGILNNVVYWLKENQTSSKLSAIGLGAKTLPGSQGTDVIDIPETIQTMDWNSTNNNTIKKLIIRSPYLHTGSAPANLNSNVIIYVPNNVAQNYKTSWSSLSNNIIGCDFTKDFLTIRFINDTIDVSTFVDSDYVGTVQDYYGVPSDVSVNLYLDSSLLNSSTYTLTTTGNHIVTAEIVSNSSYYDTSTSYTVNYTREKKDATLRVNFSPASGTQTCSVGDQLSTPTITTNNWPASVNPTISYSTDGENYSNSLPQYVDTSAAGTHAIYVKQEISNNNFTYKPQTQIFTWEYTVEEPVFGGLTVKYNITDGEVGQEIALFNGGGSSSGSSESGSSDSEAGGTLPTSMIVDGVEETPINTWRFLTPGEHIVQYTFADNLIPANYFFNRDFTSIIIGDDIVTVYSNAFTSCLNLTSVTIEKTPTIASLGFYSCENLLSITCKSTNPCFLGQQVFENTNNCPIYVPAESVESYKGGPGYWSDYASRIYPISE